LVGSLIWLTGHHRGNCQQQTEYRQGFQHDGGNVPQKPNMRRGAETVVAMLRLGG
jgi:hypothetical protein